MNTSATTTVPARDAQGRFISVNKMKAAPPVAPTVVPYALQMHVLPDTIRENKDFGERKPVFLIRSKADVAYGVKAQSVRFLGGSRAVFDTKNPLYGTGTTVWLETDGGIEYTDEWGNTKKIDSATSWQNAYRRSVYQLNSGC